MIAYYFIVRTQCLYYRILEIIYIGIYLIINKIDKINDVYIYL